MSGRYDEVLDPSIYLEDYELDPELGSAARHIQWGFGTVDEYYEARVRTGLPNELPHWRSVARSWVAIAGLASTGVDKPDNRASAIELAYSHSIDLKPDQGRLLVFPEQLLEDPKGKNVVFLKRLKDLDVEVATYPWRPNETPDSYADTIAEVVRTRLYAKPAS